MTIDFQKLRLDGVYRQNDAGQLMLRVKAPAGVISAIQAETLCSLAEDFSNGGLHLTCRGSVELHWLEHPHLSEILRRLATVGLTSRGACGGAVRGISCSALNGPGFVVAQRVARQLHRHFVGNPHFEGLPKKFKVSVETGYAGARHLIQDLGIVHTGCGAGGEHFDVWCAGGLGREPQAAFLLRQNVPENELLPLTEAVVRVYARHSPPGKRLKHVVRAVGAERLRELVATCHAPPLYPQQSLAVGLTAATDHTLSIPVFAGEIDVQRLRRVAGAARTHGDGTLVITADQNLLLFLPDAGAVARARRELADAGLLPDTVETTLTCRICPGSHECRMGLAPTRDVASRVIATLGPAGRTLTWAVSGCPNSCPQPQLAAVGIMTSKLVKGDDGSRTPRFDLYRRSGDGLGEAVAVGLELEEMLTEVRKLG
jgi:sulfite reductase beta subunit-like hemoprotein